MLSGKHIPAALSLLLWSAMTMGAAGAEHGAAMKPNGSGSPEGGCSTWCRGNPMAEANGGPRHPASNHHARRSWKAADRAMGNKPVADAEGETHCASYRTPTWAPVTIQSPSDPRSRRSAPGGTLAQPFSDGRTYETGSSDRIAAPAHLNAGPLTMRPAEMEDRPTVKIWPSDPEPAQTTREAANSQHGEREWAPDGETGWDIITMMISALTSTFKMMGIALETVKGGQLNPETAKLHERAGTARIEQRIKQTARAKRIFIRLTKQSWRESQLDTSRAERLKMKLSSAQSAIAEWEAHRDEVRERHTHPQLQQQRQREAETATSWALSVTPDEAKSLSALHKAATKAIARWERELEWQTEAGLIWVEEARITIVETDPPEHQEQGEVQPADTAGHWSAPNNQGPPHQRPEPATTTDTTPTAGGRKDKAERKAAAKDTEQQIASLPKQERQEKRIGLWTITIGPVPSQSGPTCGAHCAVNAHCRPGASQQARKAEWRRIQTTWNHLESTGQITKQQAQGHNASAAMMHAATPGERAWSGEILTVDTEATMQRKDTNWLPIATAQRLQRGEHITLKIRAESITGEGHWYAAEIQSTDRGMRATLSDSASSGQAAAQAWEAADHIREHLAAAAAGKALSHTTAKYPSHEITILNGRGEMMGPTTRAAPEATLGQLIREATHTPPGTHVLTSLGAWPAATPLAQFGHTTGVQSEHRGSEGSMMISTTAPPRDDERERDSHVVLVTSHEPGTAHPTGATHVVPLTPAQWKTVTAHDVTGLCLPQTWTTIMAQTDDGWTQLHHPDGFTMDQLEHHLEQAPHLHIYYEPGRGPGATCPPNRDPGHTGGADQAESPGGEYVFEPPELTEHETSAIAAILANPPPESSPSGGSSDDLEREPAPEPRKEPSQAPSPKRAKTPAPAPEPEPGQNPDDDAEGQREPKKQRRAPTGKARQPTEPTRAKGKAPDPTNKPNPRERGAADGPRSNAGKKRPAEQRGRAEGSPLHRDFAFAPRDTRDRQGKGYGPTERRGPGTDRRLGSRETANRTHTRPLSGQAWRGNEPPPIEDEWMDCPSPRARTPRGRSPPRRARSQERRGTEPNRHRAKSRSRSRSSPPGDITVRIMRAGIPKAAPDTAPHWAIRPRATHAARTEGNPAETFDQAATRLRARATGQRGSEKRASTFDAQGRCHATYYRLEGTETLRSLALNATERDIAIWDHHGRGAPIHVARPTRPGERAPPHTCSISIYVRVKDAVSGKVHDLSVGTATAEADASGRAILTEADVDTTANAITAWATDRWAGTMQLTLQRPTLINHDSHLSWRAGCFRKAQEQVSAPQPHTQLRWVVTLAAPMAAELLRDMHAAGRHPGITPAEPTADRLSEKQHAAVTRHVEKLASAAHAEGRLLSETQIIAEWAEQPPEEDIPPSTMLAAVIANALRARERPAPQPEAGAEPEGTAPEGTAPEGTDAPPTPGKPTQPREGAEDTANWKANKAARKKLTAALKTATCAGLRKEVVRRIRKYTPETGSEADEDSWKAYLEGLSEGGGNGEHDPQLAFTIAVAAFSDTAHEHGLTTEFSHPSALVRRAREWVETTSIRDIGRAMHRVYRHTQASDHEIVTKAPEHRISAFMVRVRYNRTEVLLTCGGQEAGDLGSKWAPPSRCQTWGTTTREATTKAAREDAGVNVPQSKWTHCGPAGAPATDPTNKRRRLTDMAAATGANQVATPGGHCWNTKWTTLEEIESMGEDTTAPRLHERAEAAANELRRKADLPDSQPAQAGPAGSIEELLDQLDQETEARQEWEDNTPTGGADPLGNLDDSEDGSASGEESDEEGEDPDDDLEDPPGSGPEHAPAEGTYGSPGPSPTQIFDIDSDGQAWALKPGSGGVRPVGEPGDFTHEDVDPELAQMTTELRQSTWAHPLMTPCTTCSGIMGEGVCRQDNECPINTARQRDECVTCGYDTRRCQTSNCKRGIEIAAVYMEHVLREIGTTKYLKACPTSDAAQEAWRHPEKTAKGLLDTKGISKAKANNVWNTTEWPIERIVHINDANTRATVTGLGNEWDISANLAPAYMVDEYRMAEAARRNLATKRTPARAPPAHMHGTEGMPPTPAPEPEPAPRRAAPKLTAEEVREQMRGAGAGHKRETDAARTRGRAGSAPTSGSPSPVRTKAPAQKAATYDTRADATNAGQDPMAIIAQMLQAIQQQNARNAEPSNAREQEATDELEDEDTLVPSRLSRQQHSIMTTLMASLGLDEDDLDMRPSLHTCVSAAGHDTTFPFRRMIGEPMGMDIDGMLDENAATPATRATEAKELRAAQREDAAAFQEGKGGALHVVAGKKPKLTKQTMAKTVTTAQDLIMALHNLAYHYGKVGQPERRRLVEEHTTSMRETWHHGALLGVHANLIAFDKALREHRCRKGKTDTWTLDTEMGSPEQIILARAVRDAHTEHANSNRPNKDRLAAKDPGQKAPADADADLPKPKKGKSKKKPKAAAAAAGESDRWSAEFFAKADKAGLCANFAWRGWCPRSKTDQCQQPGGTKMLDHSCLKCAFAPGVHDITNGSCPN